MNVAILGGTGKFGRAIAIRLAAAGDDVVIGSRDAERARQIAAELGVRGARNDEVGDVDLVVLAVEAGAALSTVRDLELHAPLLSVAAEIAFDGRVARPGTQRQSLAERVAEIANVKVAAGLHSLAAVRLAASAPEQDVFVCGDEEEPKRLALELSAKIVSGQAIDAGPLATARALEGMTAVLLNVNSTASDGDARQVEAVLRESIRVVRARPPLVIAETRHGFVCASAGVDASNAPEAGMLVLLPLDPDASARDLRARIHELTGRTVAVIVSDSFGRPWRQGTTDVAIGVAGLAPLLDLRGRRDAAGYELRSTQIAVADELAGAAELVMGKTSGVPGAVISGFACAGDGSARELVMPAERDLFR